MNRPELILVPHHELSYDEADRREIGTFTVEEMKNFDKVKAVLYARAMGFPETGMSQNEVGLLYDLLEQKKPKQIVELGRNYGCSTRILLQYVVRHGGYLESWDLKHWGNLEQSFADQGFVVNRFQQALTDDHDYTLTLPDATAPIAACRVADSMKTNIETTERWVDFLLIDTEHGLENALGEYMRWRHYLKSGSIIAFHDSTLPAVARAIELAIEVESDFDGRLAKQYRNERIEGFGLEALEWKG